MKKGFCACFSILLLLVSVSLVRAGSPVWKVAKGEHHLFIGGTIHLLGKADFPLPEAFEKAYEASSIVVFEADIQELQTPEFQKAIVSQTRYPEGTNLAMFLEDATREHFVQYLASRQIPMDNIVKFKAGMVSITLTVVELQRLGLAGSGVDEFYSLRALNDGKEIGQLETAGEQLAFIATIGEGKEDELITYTLHQMEDLPKYMGSIKAAWREGDNARLEEVAMNSMEKDFPEMADQLVYARNAAWLPKIEALLQTDAIEFVLVGALHLVGENGLLEHLKGKGYAVEMQ